MIKNERTIILGIDFDGAPVQGDDPLFVSRMGPKSFLDFLEIHSGLIPVHSSPIERIASFLAVLQENKGNFPFYADSWEKAPFASAKRMLEWIDAWYIFMDGVVKLIRLLIFQRNLLHLYLSLLHWIRLQEAE